jgi:hypothetical protein
MGPDEPARHYDYFVLNQDPVFVGGFMIYMLEFLGLVAVACSLAASPLLIKVIERFFPSVDDEGHAAYGLTNSVASDRAEVRDEIRRVTSILESSHLRTGNQGLTPAAKR